MTCQFANTGLPENMGINLRTITCNPLEAECLEHCDIVAHVADIQAAGESRRIGHIKLYHIGKAQMERRGSGEMWRQCQTYDHMHLGGKLGKIENFLANESFVPDAETAISEAENVVYIEDVVLNKNARGHDLGLSALGWSITALHLSPKTVLLLELGGVGQLECSHEEVGEKLAKHWSRLGFRTWSYTDEAWMCLALGEMVTL